MNLSATVSPGLPPELIGPETTLSLSSLFSESPRTGVHTGPSPFPFQ